MSGWDYLEGLVAGGLISQDAADQISLRIDGLERRIDEYRMEIASLDAKIEELSLRMDELEDQLV